jgi:hypothetical protein
MEDIQESRRNALPEVAALLALTLLVCGAFFAAQLHALDGGLGLPLDDSWIHLAFARNLAEGGGWGIQPGELVAASTAPLWSVLVALGVVLPVPDLLWMEVLGTCFHAGGVLLTWLLARRLGLSRGLAFLAGVLTAVTGWLSWSALSGMEISLFVFLSLAGIVLHLRERLEPRRFPLSLPVLGLSVLARPEGVLLLALAAGDRLLRLRRRPEGSLVWERPSKGGLARLGLGLALAGVAVVPVAAFYTWIGGSPLPTTLAAKTGGGGGLHLPDLQYLHVALGPFLLPQPWMTLLAPVGVVALLRRLGTPADRGLLPALWLVGLPLAYSCLTETEGNPLMGNFGRYYFPLLPLVVVLGVLGLERVAAAAGLAGRRSGGRRVLAIVAVAVVVWPTLAAAARTATLYADNVSDVARGDVAMARWLAARLPEDAVVATMDIGALAAILPNRIVDLAGIANPEIHEYVRRAEASGESWQEGTLRFIADRRPDYLVVFPEWLTAVERPGSPFRPLHGIHVPGNVTLGRDTLVLYATPWTRYPLRGGTDETGGRPVP